MYSKERTFNIQLMLAKKLPWIMENDPMGNGESINTKEYWNAWRDIIKSRHGDFYEDSAAYPFDAVEFSEKYKDQFAFSANLRVDDMHGNRLFFTSIFQLSENVHVYNTYGVKEKPHEQLVVFSKFLSPTAKEWRDFVLDNEELFVDPNEESSMGFGANGGGGFGGFGN